MYELGLVFAGGGGKGAYEIGVWKYFHEIGLDQYVKVVSGTSVGALNAALVVGSSYETAEEIWLNINPNMILTPRKFDYKDIIEWFTMNCIDISTRFVGLPWIREKIMLQMFLNRIRNDYFFSRTGIEELISKGLDFAKLKTTDILCYVTCMRCKGMKIERFILNQYSCDKIITLLLASSAIPIIFPTEEFYGFRYCDGGIPVIGDNVPIKPVYDAGIKNIIVVHLDQKTNVDKSKFPNAKIIEIVPSKDLGKVIDGTLDFSESGAFKRLQLGYKDAKSVFQFGDVFISSV